MSIPRVVIRATRRWKVWLGVALALVVLLVIWQWRNLPFVPATQRQAVATLPIGVERAVPKHLQDGEEYKLPLPTLLAYGKDLFTANWTSQEGAGRPMTKGNGAPLLAPHDPLVFPRNFNRVSGPDANSCAGCHDAPFGTPGGGGDIVANVFVLGQRFDFATFDPTDTMSGHGTRNEAGEPTTLQTIANERATLGMFGSGYIEMLARHMTRELQAIRDQTPPGGSRELIAKGVSFGTIARNADGTWDTDGVEGLALASLETSGADDPPDLIIRPFHQAGQVVSLRQFTNNAYNHHHGIQTAERFGVDQDPDEDGFVNEMTRADVTAVTLYQATLPVPGRVIPRDPAIEQAVLLGEVQFSAIGCADCHVPALPLARKEWIFVEPNPYNPQGNLQIGDASAVIVNLNGKDLPPPRLSPDADGVVWVPAFTDLKLHDITSGPDDPNREPLNQEVSPENERFFDGNGRFLTKKLWGAANEPPYFHHGRFTTMREAVLAHDGEARESREAFEALPTYDQDAVIEFLKTLQVLPPGTLAQIVDQYGLPRPWPPR